MPVVGDGILPITAAKADDACPFRSRMRRYRSGCHPPSRIARRRFGPDRRTHPGRRQRHDNAEMYRPPDRLAAHGDSCCPAHPRAQNAARGLAAGTGAHVFTGEARPPCSVVEHDHEARSAGNDAYLTEPMPLPGRNFEADVMTRLQRGEHIVLYGPRGSGKSTLLARLHSRIAQQGIPCALSTATAHLDDVTRAFARAYPSVDTTFLPKRKARARLRTAADRNEGVLLLDHVTDISTATIGFLRRLRGGIAGVLLAVDVEKERDGQHLRHRHLGTLSLPMPPAAAERLRGLFRKRCAMCRLPRIPPNQQRQIIRAARGRPGWIMQCARLIPEERYWRGKLLRASLLCVDTEIALRQGRLKLIPPKADGDANQRITRGIRVASTKVDE